MLWLCCAYYYLSIPILILSVVGAGGAAVLGILASGYIPIKLLVIIGGGALITIFAILRSIFTQRTDQDPDERLDLAEHSRLREVLDEVAAKVGTRAVDTVFFTPGTDIAVFERGGVTGQLRGNAERCLILGAGVMDGMKLSSFKAILAHEYGHFSNRDTAGGGLALMVRASVGKMASGMAEGGVATRLNPAWLFLEGFFHVFLRVSQGASRLQEVLADRFAAYAYGSEPFVDGLMHSIEQSVRFDAHVSSTISEVIDGKRPLANLYRYQPKEPVSEEDIETAVSEALQQEPTAYDSHPAPADRIAWVRALGAAGEVSRDRSGESDAWSLLNSRRKLERAMTNEVRSNVALSFGVEIAKPKKKRKKPAEDNEN